MKILCHKRNTLQTGYGMRWGGKGPNHLFIWSDGGLGEEKIRKSSESGKLRIPVAFLGEIGGSIDGEYFLSSIVALCVVRRPMRSKE